MSDLSNVTSTPGLCKLDNEFVFEPKPKDRNQRITLSPINLSLNSTKLFLTLKHVSSPNF